MYRDYKKHCIVYTRLKYLPSDETGTVVLS